MRRKREADGAQPPNEAGGERARAAAWLEAAREELAANWDTDVAIGLGVIVGLLGIFQVTSLEITLGLVLVAVAAVAGSLRSDRSLREQLRGTVEELKEAVAGLESKFGVVSRALSSPLPYEVVSGHYKWDFEPGGKVAKVSKRARIRFVNNGTWTILQWHSAAVDVREATAHRLTNQGQRKKLDVLDGPTDPPQQRVGKLVTLDQECRQSEVLDFEYGYASYENFNGDREWVNIDIETSTEDLTIEFIWSADRRPRSIWRVDDGERTALSTEQAEGRHRTKLKFQHLTRGKKVLVQWDWLALEELEGND